MEVKNPKYRNQGIHVLAALFTIDKGVPKVLLIRRNNEPYQGMWALVGGALYNDETVKEGLRREIKEKTGIDNIYLELFQEFSRVDRSKVMRMVALAYIGLVDRNKVNLLKETKKTLDADWFSFDQIPTLAYDHNEILTIAIDVLKRKLTKSDILKNLYPEGFTMPEIQKVYEGVFQKQYDRRNFRKKLLQLGWVEATNRAQTFDGKKPARVYVWKEIKEDKNVF